MNKKATGIRAELRELAKPDHMAFPRKHRLQNRIEFYLDGGMAGRPTYGIRAMARIAENMLRTVKTGKHKGCSSDAYTEVVSFYADTRRCINDLLTACPVSKRITKDVSDRFAARYLGLVERCARVRKLLASDSETVEILRLRKADADLLRALVTEASRNGLVPSGSRLMKFAVDTAHGGVL